MLDILGEQLHDVVTVHKVGYFHVVKDCGGLKSNIKFLAFFELVGFNFLERNILRLEG